MASLIRREAFTVTVSGETMTGPPNIKHLSKAANFNYALAMRWSSPVRCSTCRLFIALTLFLDVRWTRWESNPRTEQYHDALTRVNSAGRVGYLHCHALAYDLGLAHGRKLKCGRSE